MRRMKKEKTFKGSIFVTFADKETAEKFANDEDSKKFKDDELVKLMQDTYWAQKSAETKEKRKAEKDLKKQKQAEQKAEQEKNTLATHFIKGSVLEVSGLGDNKHKYDDIKVFFKKFGDVAFVAYETGNDEAQIRFDAKEEGTASAAWERAKEKGEGKVVFQDLELTGHVLEGEEEEAYWAEFTKSKVAKNDRHHQQRRGQKRRGGRDRGDERTAKHTKFEED